MIQQKLIDPSANTQLINVSHHIRLSITVTAAEEVEEVVVVDAVDATVEEEAVAVEDALKLTAGIK